MNIRFELALAPLLGTLLLFHLLNAGSLQPGRIEHPPASIGKRNTTIVYIASDVDPSSVREVIQNSNLTDRFKRYSIQESDQLGQATNALLFGSSVNLSDVEFLRKKLSNAGVHFDTVRREERWVGEKSNRIWVGHY